MTAKTKILFVEDDTGLQRQLRWSFPQYEVLTASNRPSALRTLQTAQPRVVLLDLGLPPEPHSATEGLATLEEILKTAPATKVVVMTGNDERQNAVRAVGLGAYDYYQKPIDVDVLGTIIDRAVRLTALEDENRRAAAAPHASPLTGIISNAPEMLRLCRMIEKVAPADVSVLLLGESGTGKEVIAKALHELSPRAGKPFIAINCGAIPENLLESELFGHERGAFTGAVKLTKGKVELAHGGSLMLDEIGDLPLPLQVKLLRFLQERVIERVGGRQSIPVDVRIICATHQNLQDLMRAGRFREDLFYRLDEVVIRIPPLRDRETDAQLLAQHFLTRFNVEHGRKVKGFSADALAALAAHTWPGNIRELQNRLKRAVIMADGPVLSAHDLDLGVPDVAPGIVDLRKAREQAERAALQRALMQEQGNLSRAARLLGVSRPTLYDLMRHHNLKA
jgi:two-component system, NtrC family, response regulator